MPHYHLARTVEGSVTDIFAHRFVIETGNEKILADYGKHNSVLLKMGDKVSATGKMRPAEFKVDSMSVNGKSVKLDDHKENERRDSDRRESGPADMEAIKKTAEKQDIQIVGERRMPKHVEVLGVDQTNSPVEVHVELDGKLKTVKRADRQDEKWGDDMPPE